MMSSGVPIIILSHETSFSCHIAFCQEVLSKKFSTKIMNNPDDLLPPPH